MDHNEENNIEVKEPQTQDQSDLCASYLSRGCTRPPDPETTTDQIYQGRCCKYDNFDWLKNIHPPDNRNKFPFVEVRFKNSRKEFFRFNTDYELEEGEIVAVESNPGHDIGIVSMTGELVRVQMKRKKVHPESENMKHVYRKARLSDIQKWVKAVEKEESTKLKSREIAHDHKLDMKINDVEYQGDDTKAIFYYTADERVDFRELIKVLAEKFRVRIEMRQIGARQEASRIGGIGSCGRELCCATWMCDFKSVTTQAARTQQLTLNPQKLAGQCGKLKCCLNYEYPTYIDALKAFPDTDVRLNTKNGEAGYQKSDVFKKLMWYSYVNDESSLMAIPIDKVKQIIKMNKKGKKPEKLEDFALSKEQKSEYDNDMDMGDLDRFD
ncbi:MAG: hypothetical protein K9G67_06530 [Bacteroidales bacterium]|nr:hypothetical protein [Bacteroidales bacterium]MCF8343022.1 hypothetical protein [Bacteroidales bacterium]MCF8350262.1 hypothetical protein [Bacteroidales bacterium]MCF8375994.1 hypothetical protein [Bacteroidales bacterium]MCF8400482.1 hypothetical protein [Bacteroidales bacterium]